jgi:hypothetical protein
MSPPVSHDPTSIRRATHRRRALTLAAAAIAVFAFGCGGKDRLTIEVRDETNRPVSRVEIRQVGSDHLLGATDAQGRAEIEPERGDGEIQVRLSLPDDAAAAYDFKNPHTLDEDAFARGTYFARVVAGAGGGGDDSTATLVVESTPAGAEVLVDGAPRGVTPATIAPLPPGRAQLAIRLAGWHAHEVELYLEGGETRYAHELIREEVSSAMLLVLSDPEGASVWLDGRRTESVTPARLADLPPGRHRVKVALDGFAPFETQVALEAGREGVADAGPLRRAESRPAARSGASAAGSAGMPARTSGAASERPAGDAASAAAFRRTYKVSTYPAWAQVYVDDDPVDRNEMGNFKITLDEGAHHFRLVNERAGVNVVVKYAVKAGDTMNKLILDYERRAVDARP